jgi:membrane-bound lytic murein transglycosylase B
LILRALLIGLLPLSAMAQTEPAAPAPEPAADPFAAWKTTFTPRAFAAGIRPDTLARAYARLEWLPDVIDRDRNQNEFTKTVWDYLDTAVSDDRIARGQQALATHAALFDTIESRWGVDRHIVTAIWGLETSYGAPCRPSPPWRSKAAGPICSMPSSWPP